MGGAVETAIQADDPMRRGEGSWRRWAPVTVAWFVLSESDGILMISGVHIGKWKPTVASDKNQHISRQTHARRSIFFIDVL